LQPALELKENAYDRPGLADSKARMQRRSVGGPAALGSLAINPNDIIAPEPGEV